MSKSRRIGKCFVFMTVLYFLLFVITICFEEVSWVVVG